METPVYQYVLRKEDFLDAQRLYRKHNRRAALSYYLWIWIVPVLGLCLVLAYSAAVITRRADLMQQLMPAAAAGAWFAIFVPIMRWWQIRKLWKASLDPVADGKPVTLQFDNEQLISAIPGKSEGRFFWTALVDYAEDDRLTMLFIRKKRFLYIPKHALPESAWAQIRELATNRPSSRE